MQRRHYHFELLHGVLRNVRCGIAAGGGAIGQGIVALVVRKSTLDQMPVIEKVVHRQQLNGRDAQACQVFDHNL